jgi:hypothetical protein
LVLSELAITLPAKTGSDAAARCLGPNVGNADFRRLIAWNDSKASGAHPTIHKLWIELLEACCESFDNNVSALHPSPYDTRPSYAGVSICSITGYKISSTLGLTSARARREIEAKRRGDRIRTKN